MKAEAMRAKSADELKALVLELRKEQMALRFQASSGQLEQTTKLNEVRRNIARAKTLLSENARGVKVAPKATAKPAKKAPAKKAAAKADKE